jgi:D-alanine-D-alanine ligase
MKLEKEPPGIAVLYNASTNLIKGEPRDLLAEQGVIVCAHAIADALEGTEYQVALVPIYDQVEVALASFSPTQWMVFNLGEGLEGRLFEEARIAWTLEAMGYQFTGSKGDALARGLNKARTKALLAAHGVDTPPWALFRHPDEITETVVDDLGLPLIVKPVAEDASIGVGPDAVVRTREALRERVAYIVDRYRQAALVERFIVGREFNIALWDNAPEILPLAEIDFSAFEDPYERIVSFAAKWEANSFEYHHTPVCCPARVPAQLREDITQAARQAWAVIGCRGYARVDMRVSPEGIPYVVEVNCNPDLSPDAGFYHAARAAGYSYRDMVIRIIEIARREAYVHDRNGYRDGWHVDPEDHGRGKHFHTVGNRLRTGSVERLPG